MEYERIEMVQKTGMISPTKLRMKFMGQHHNRKKDKSNSNSSRTSPSRLGVEDSDFSNNSLLSSTIDFEDEANVPGETVVDLSQTATPNHPKERVETGNEEMGNIKSMQSTKGELNSIHPMRMPEDENLDYDSNASSSSFEFQEAEKSVHSSISRSSYSRPMPSKWNDAEKWIMNRQNRSSKTNTTFSGQGNRMPPVGVAPPESANYDQNKAKTGMVMMANRVVDTKRVDFCQPVQHAIERKHSSIPLKNSVDDQPAKNNCVEEPSSTKRLSEETIVVPAIRSVCMRDMGTEMTPAASLEPSRTATPEGSRTPFRSPPSSMPSTPRGREAPAASPTAVEPETQRDQYQNAKRAFSEQELKEKTKREIVALGVQLGKMNIAAWASKEEPWDENGADFGEKGTNAEELERIQFGKRAMAWEEAEISKHNARFKREELRIQAWESQQKTKLEAEMRRVEAKIEQMRAQVQAKTVKNIATAKQRAEAKRAAAEARKNRDAERAAAQAEYIRQTGKLPSNFNYMCCGWII